VFGWFLGTDEQTLAIIRAVLTIVPNFGCSKYQRITCDAPPPRCSIKYQTCPNNIIYNLRFFEAFEITRTAISLTLILFQTNRTSSPLSLKYMKNGDWQVIKNQIATQYWNLIQPFCTRKSLSKNNIKNQKLKMK
jgi:hypothetical protein